MRTVIVDDEPIARRVLREELEQFPEVEIVAEAADGREALQEIGKLQPDLVFLDLQMPVLSGFEVVRNLSQQPLPIIVMVTAFDQHAIQAFEAGAIDYLLKPVGEARLRRSVERAKALLERPQEIVARADRISLAGELPAAPAARRIVGRNGDDYHMLDLNEVLAFQAERELVWIVTPRRRFLAAQPLRAIAGRLADSHFQRVHRNAIVNVDHIRKMTALSSQRWLVTLSNGLQLIASKRQAQTIRNLLRWC